MILQVIAAKLLLARGADLRAVDEAGRPPLAYALAWAKGGGCPCAQFIAYDASREWAAVVTLLERLERMPEGECRASVQRTWALHVSSALQPPSECGDLRELSCLLSYYANDVNARDYDGSTALHAASQAGQVEALRLLLDKGAHVNVAGHCGETALHFAAREGHLAVTELLLARGAALDALTVSGVTPRVYATRHQSRQWEAVAKLL